jgi:hypothetical protein
MADEIKDDALVEEALADIGFDSLNIEAKKKERFTQKRHKKRTVNKTNIFTADIVELMLTEVISQLKLAMDSIFLIEFDKETKAYDSFNTAKKRIEAIKGTHYIFCAELSTILHCFEPYHNAALNKKHRAIKAVANEGWDRLTNLTKGIQKAKRIDNHYIIQFAEEMCLFMTNFHVVLHKDTPNKERQRIVEEYCE